MEERGNILDVVLYDYRIDVRGALAKLDSLHICCMTKVGDPEEV
jgi:hypothetical protein